MPMPSRAAITGLRVSDAGILAGPLCYLISIKSVTMVGSLAAVVGMIGASFAPTLLWMSVTLGIIHGMGGGIIRTMLQVYLSMNYEKNRGTAHGLMFAGATLSSFVFPTVLVYLQRTFSTRGCMLIQAAILSHFFPLCMGINKQDSDNVPKQPTANSHDSSVQTAKELAKSEASSSTSPVIAQHAWKILSTPMFYVIVTSWLILIYTIELIFMTIVDFAFDIGLSADSSLTLLAGYAVTDLCGRVVLPSIADKEYVRTSTLMGLNYFFLGSAMLALAEVRSYVSLLFVGAFSSIFMGCGLAMHGVLLAKYIGLERLPLSYAVAGILSGPMVILKPVVVGYYRDNSGSYNNVYRLLGGLLLSLCVPWCATILFERREDTKNKQDIVHTSCANHGHVEKSALLSRGSDVNSTKQ